MRTLYALFSAVAVGSAMAPAWAQAPLLREDDPSPDGAAGQTITSLGVPAVNAQGGYAVSIISSGTNGSRSQFWGSLTGGPGALLREETTIGNLEQTVLETYFGINATQLAYRATATDTGTGTTSLDSVWIDNVLVVNEDDPVSGTANFWRFMERVDITDGGEPYFLGGITDVVGGSTQDRGLYFGSSLTPVHVSGVTYPNMPFPTGGNVVRTGYRYSSNGSHLLAELVLDAGSTGDLEVMAFDGAGLVLGGALVLEGSNIPTSIGGVGDAWDNFDYMGVNEAGDYAFTGDTDGSSSADEFLVRNGAIWAREGDVLGGATLDGSIRSFSMNEGGNIAFVWGIDVGPGAPDDALFYEDALLLQEGDMVDWDGDGVLDPNSTIASFSGLNSMVLSDSGVIYLTLDIDVNGSRLEGLFAISSGDLGRNYCTAVNNATGVPSSMGAAGSDEVSSNSFALLTTGLPTNQFGIFLASMTQDFSPGANNTSNGNLCLGGAIGRFIGTGQILNSGTGGQFNLAVDLTQIPQGNGFAAVMPGQTWNFQAWHRSGMGLGSNFSDGLEVTFR